MQRPTADIRYMYGGLWVQLKQTAQHRYKIVTAVAAAAAATGCFLAVMENGDTLRAKHSVPSSAASQTPSSSLFKDNAVPRVK